MLNTWLRNLRRQLLGTSNCTNRKLRAVRRRAPLVLEDLEDRTLLANTILSAPGITPANWMSALADGIPLTEISLPGTVVSAAGPSLNQAFFGASYADVIDKVSESEIAALTAHNVAGLASAVAEGFGGANAAANAAAIAAKATALAADSYIDATGDGDYLETAADAAELLGQIAHVAEIASNNELIPPEVAGAALDGLAATSHGSTASDFNTYSNGINVSASSGGNSLNAAYMNTLYTDAKAVFGTQTAAAIAAGLSALNEGLSATADTAEATAAAAAAAADAALAAEAIAAPIADGVAAAADATAVAVDATAAGLDVAAAAELGLDPVVDAAAAVADGVAAADDAAAVTADGVAAADDAALAADGIAAPIADEAAVTAATAAQTEDPIATGFELAQTATGLAANIADDVFTEEAITAANQIASLQTQSQSISAQLNSGIRSLDIDGSVVNGTIDVNDGNYYTGQNLQDVLNSCTSFLDANPNETIVMTLNSTGSQNSFSTDLSNLLNSSDSAAAYSTYNDFIYYSSNSSTTPTLGEARGKIVIIPSGWSLTSGNQELGWTPTQVVDDTASAANTTAAWNSAESPSGLTSPTSGLLGADLGSSSNLYVTNLDYNGTDAATQTFNYTTLTGNPWAPPENTIAQTLFSGFHVTRTTGIVGMDDPSQALINDIINENNLPILVTSDADTVGQNSAGSFRAAIDQANSQPGVNTIEFAGTLTGSTGSVIKQAGNMPAITNNLIVSGTTIIANPNMYSDISAANPATHTVMEYTASANSSSLTEQSFQSVPFSVINNATYLNHVPLLVNLYGDPTTNSGSGFDGSLRYCVNQANTYVADGINVTIDFGIVGTILLTSSLGPLVFTTPTANPGYTITVEGGITVVDGQGDTQDFNIQSGANVVLTDLELENGLALNGGAVANAGTLALNACNLVGNSATNSGAGLYNTGSLTVSDSLINNNTAKYGGGLANLGQATVIASTFTANKGTDTGGGAENYGGSLTLSNSTLVGNRAGTGGGVENYSGELTLSNDTIAYNTATDAGGGVYNRDAAAMTLLNTIVTGNVLTNNTPNDVSGTIPVANSNLIGQNSGFDLVSATSNQLGVSAGLAPTLANNGGPTQTLALLVGSNATGAGGALTSVGANNIGSTDTTIAVANAAAIAQTPGDYLIRIGQELMLVTSVNTTLNTLTVQRGVDGSTAISHPGGSNVFLASDQRGVDFQVAPSIGAYTAGAWLVVDPSVRRG